MRRILPLLLWTGCQATGGYSFPKEPLQLVVTEPAYGVFLGDAPIVVAGSVTDPTALVWVEGRPVVVGTDGTFRVELPVDGDYRVVDVEASAPSAHLRQRIPVFAGEDPLEAWPGALTLRIGPSGLAGIAEDLGATVDGLVGGLFPDPSEVTLVPGDDGLALTITLRGALLEFDVLGFAVALGMDEVTLGATVLPEVDAAGMLALSLTDATLTLGEVTVEGGGIDPLVLEGWLDGLLADFSYTLDALADDLIANLGTISLGGPIAFETDLLGTPLAISVDALWTDADGIGGSLGAVIGDDPAPPEPIPAPSAAVGFGRADVSLGVHEGLLQLLLASELLSLLEQDIDLSGIFADIIGLTIAGLPGGTAAPDVDTWCLNVSPGEARAARLQGGTDPLLKLFLPDLQVEIGYSNDEVTCADWLVAALELEVDVALTEGTQLDLGLRVADGAVLEYATTAPWEEAEVVQGLGGLITSLVDLLGGSLELDLADLLGGGSTSTGGLLGGLEPQVIDSEPMYGDAGQIPGLYALSLKLWD